MVVSSGDVGGSARADNDGSEDSVIGSGFGFNRSTVHDQKYLFKHSLHTMRNKQQ